MEWSGGWLENKDCDHLVKGAVGHAKENELFLAIFWEHILGKMIASTEPTLQAFPHQMPSEK